MKRNSFWGIIVIILCVVLITGALISPFGDKAAIREAFNVREDVELSYKFFHLWGKNCRVYTDGRSDYIVTGWGFWRHVAMEGPGSSNF